MRSFNFSAGRRPCKGSWWQLTSLAENGWHWSSGDQGRSRGAAAATAEPSRSLSLQIEAEHASSLASFLRQWSSHILNPRGSGGCSSAEIGGKLHFAEKNGRRFQNMSRRVRRTRIDPSPLIWVVSFAFCKSNLMLIGCGTVTSSFGLKSIQKRKKTKRCHVLKVMFLDIFCRCSRGVRRVFGGCSGGGRAGSCFDVFWSFLDETSW